MRASLLLFCLLILIILFRVDSVSAQSERSLYTVKVHTLDRKIVRGTLNAADEKGIYLVRKSGDTSMFINALQIKELKLRRKSKASTGTTIGFLSGLAAGTGMVIALHNNDRVENAARTVGAVLFTFTTTAIAGAISSKPDEVIKINGRSEDYLQTLQHIQSFTPLKP